MAVKEDPRIHTSFRRGERPKVKTVAKLIEELQQLPGTLKICGDWGLGVRVGVTNLNDKHLALHSI